MSRAATTWALLGALGLLVYPAAELRAQDDPPTPFDQGRVRVSVSGGTGGTTANRYFVIGAGVGVFVMDGLEIGLGVDSWLGGDPTLTKLTPSLRYIFHFVPTIHPYLGGFYRHWFVADDQPDVDSLGATVGIVTIVAQHMFVGGGVVYEAIVSECETDCWDIYPELLFSVSF